MPRLKRFTIENGNYHILSRGHNKKEIFHSDDDFKKYLQLLQSEKEKFNVKIYHYVIMDNHVHVISNSPDGNSLTSMMRGINQGYAQYYRKKYGGCGYVWQDRFKSFLIENGRYLLVSGRYVEINPVIAGIVKLPEEYRWSSYNVYAFGKQDAVVDFNPEYIGLANEDEHRKRLYRDFVKDGIIEKERRSGERFFKDGVFGSNKFVEKLKMMGLKQTWSHSGHPWDKKNTEK